MKTDAPTEADMLQLVGPYGLIIWKLAGVAHRWDLTIDEARSFLHGLMKEGYWCIVPHPAAVDPDEMMGIESFVHLRPAETG